MTLREEAKELKEETGEMEMIRLSKLVSQQSVCSRREAEKLISLGLIRVNGARVY